MLEYLGNVNGLQFRNQAGDIDSEGNLYVTGDSGRLYKIDLNTLQADSIAFVGYSVSDIAINPDNGKFYGWTKGNANLFLISIDPNTGVTTQIGPPNFTYKTMGATYFNAQGELIAYGDNRYLNTTTQETLVKIDINSGIVSEIGVGPNARSNDGCSCTFGVELTKSAASPQIISGDEITYNFSIFNQSGSPIDSVVF